MASASAVTPLAPPETEHTLFIKRYLNKTLRVSVTDGRVFAGQLKCTDKECNLVLALTNEYRQPPEDEVKNAAAGDGNVGGAASGKGVLQMEFTSRYVGLVVIPGEYIVKIEWEEFVPT